LFKGFFISVSFTKGLAFSVLLLLKIIYPQLQKLHSFIAGVNVIWQFVVTNYKKIFIDEDFLTVFKIGK